MLHRIIRYSVNEVAYNEGLICWDVGFVVEREDCTLNKFINLSVVQDLFIQLPVINHVHIIIDFYSSLGK